MKCLKNGQQTGVSMSELTNAKNLTNEGLLPIFA